MLSTRQLWLTVALSYLPDHMSDTMINGDREYTDVRAEAEMGRVPDAGM